MNCTARCDLVSVAQTGEVLTIPGMVPGWLSKSERARWDSLHRETDRNDYLAAHLLLRLTVAMFTGRPPGNLQIGHWCAECCSAVHGRPYVIGIPELSVSLSHSNGVVAAAAGRSAIGVDVEAQLHQPLDADLVAGVLTAGETAMVRSSHHPHHEFLRLWTRKEALVKVGAASIDSLREIDARGSIAQTESASGHPVNEPGWYAVEFADAGYIVSAVGRRPIVLADARGLILAHGPRPTTPGCVISARWDNTPDDLNYSGRWPA